MCLSFLPHIWQILFSISWHQHTTSTTICFSLWTFCYYTTLNSLSWLLHNTVRLATFKTCLFNSLNNSRFLSLNFFFFLLACNEEYHFFMISIGNKKWYIHTNIGTKLLSQLAEVNWLIVSQNALQLPR